MTMSQFVRLVKDEAKKKTRPVLAVDFEPAPQGVMLTFRFKEEQR